MFIPFFQLLKSQGITVSLKEFLHLMEALAKGICPPDIEEFYYLSRSLLVKHEGQLDRYDQLFGHYFKGQDDVGQDLWDDIPEEWIKAHFSNLTPEEQVLIEEMGGIEALIERFRELMKEQQERHEGGDTFIGTLGSSPYGNEGDPSQGYHIGPKRGNNNEARKVWEKREYANLDDKKELNTRSIKMALRQLRLLTREGRPTELDLDRTIRKTSENAGMLDLHLVPSRKNRVKVLLLLDIGGSMDDHIELCADLFSAARYEFKHLEAYYFHNCLYEYVWRDNRRRYTNRIPTWELLHTYSRDYKLIFVGDAAMSPTELMYQGGSVEHWNEEPGFVWLERMRDHFSHIVWLNPNPEEYWDLFDSTRMLNKFFDKKMYPLTLEGIGHAMKSLKAKR
ncbi:MAG: VWA domain-containing protein [Bacteroidota bacterium]